MPNAESRNATCPLDKKQARFADSGGMYLQVSPAGSKRWFLKYRVGGKEKQLAMGSYLAVSLTAARKARDLAKVQKAAGADPAQDAQMGTHAEKFANEQNKLLEEDHGQPGQRMDTRAAQTAERSYQAVETVESVHRAKKPEGKAAVAGNAWAGGHWLKLRQAIKALNQALSVQRDRLGR